VGNAKAAIQAWSAQQVQKALEKVLAAVKTSHLTEPEQGQFFYNMGLEDAEATILQAIANQGIEEGRDI
jgi:uncharacterized protein (DUF2164 family)